ncbi:hypothetical protein R3P38DRAFT_3091844 [Favolaschia claudopus]|uniref:Uncharacterized protein n=1 Tax=Favolaschia claudopus TaxID=2862362 RepID=A0AAV9ZRV8_9AGAR
MKRFVSQAYKPYNKGRHPQISNAGADYVIHAALELKRINGVDGKLCTFDRNEKRWVEVARPQYVKGGKRFDYAASSCEKVWGKYSSPFFCPHLRWSGERFDPLILVAGLPGEPADYFRAFDHECNFRISILPVRERRVLLSFEDREQFDAEHNVDDDNDDDEPSPSSASASMALTSSSSSGTTATSTPPSSQRSVLSTGSTISQLAVDAMLAPHARWGGDRNTSTPPRPTQLRAGTGTTLQGSPIRSRSFYTKNVADARKAGDTVLMAFLQDTTSSGLLREDPAYHPAWDEHDPPSLLHVYDVRIYPNCLQKTYTHLDFLSRPLGKAIREINSPLGIPFSDHTTLVKATRVCKSCLNHFSPDGYEHHRRDDACTNHPDLAQIDECEPFDGCIRLRTFRDGKRPSFQAETLDSAIGAALLEWNSRLGLPADVWMTVSSAVVHCTDCDLTRTFPAHRLHLDEQGACNDAGQAVFAASGDDD